MSRLKLIGYWHSSIAPQWPDPGAFVDPEWDARVRAQVVEYLNAGKVLWVSPGMSWCRFHCPRFSESGLGGSELTNGEFLWPSGLAHYVADHNVRLPDEFVASITHGRVPAFDPAQSWIDVPVDTDWWRGQRGFGSQAQTFLTPTPDPRPIPRRRLVARTSGVAPTATLLRILRRFPEARSRSFWDLREAVLRADDIVLIYGAPQPEFDGLRQELDAIGVKTTVRGTSVNW